LSGGGVGVAREPVGSREGARGGWEESAEAVGGRFRRVVPEGLVRGMPAACSL
jgi:hypothetical protein